MPSSYKRVHVPKFCERCGKEEFEGTIWGKDFTRHLRVDSPEMSMICDHCKAPPKPLGGGFAMMETWPPTAKR
jgi:hypothetical protein